MWYGTLEELVGRCLREHDRGQPVMKAPFSPAQVGLDQLASPLTGRQDVPFLMLAVKQWLREASPLGSRTLYSRSTPEYYL